MKKFKFISSHNVDHYTVHSLFKHLVNPNNEFINLDNLNFKIWYQSKFIFLIIDESLVHNVHQSFFFLHDKKKIEINLDSSTDLSLSQFNNGDSINIYGLINYAVHSRNDLKNYCPINNNSIIPSLKDSLFSFIQKNIGVEINDSIINSSSFENYYFNKSVFSRINHNKIILNNSFFINFKTSVVDQNIVNSLQYNSIARKRNYGFGNIFFL